MTFYLLRSSFLLLLLISSSPSLQTTPLSQPPLPQQQQQLIPNNVTLSAAMKAYLADLESLEKETLAKYPKWVNTERNSNWRNPLTSFFANDDNNKDEEKCQEPLKAQSEAVAYTYSRFAAAAYCLLPSSLTSWTCTSHCTHSTTVGTSNITVQEDFLTGAKYYMAVNEPLKSIIISFRGTLNPTAILTDAYFIMNTYDNHPQAPVEAKTHAGFSLAYNKVASDIKARYTALKKRWPKFQTAITGHSMGGALALLCALDLHGSGLTTPENIDVYTYGQPRVGNEAFVKFVSEIRFNSITRVTYNNDLIPNLPPQFIYYQHNGREMHLEGIFKQGELSTVGSWSEWITAKLKSLFGNEVVMTLGNGDTCSEDPKGILRYGVKLNILAHLRVWDINFGPWC